MGIRKNTLVDPKILKREAKAEKLRQRAVEQDKTAKELRAQIPNKRFNYQKEQLRETADSFERAANQSRKDAELVSQGRLTTTQKRLIIGAVGVSALVLAVKVNDMHESGEFQQMKKRGEAFLNGDKAISFKKRDDYANKTYSSDEIMKNVVPGINPDYGSWGTNMNCRRCTFAYELRRRGFDVEATKTSNAKGQNIMGMINALHPGQKTKSTSMRSIITESMKENRQLKELSRFAAGGKNAISLDEFRKDASFNVFNTLNKQPSGSRGEFGAMWKSAVPGIPGGGHSMAYEIIKGKAHIFDAQTGKEYKPGDKIFDMMESAGFTRLDNVDLNMDYLARWVKDRG